MSAYKKTIITATGCPPEDAKIVEEWMRDKVSTLDRLCRREFNKLARDAYKALIWSRTPDGQAYIAKLEKEFYEPSN